MGLFNFLAKAQEKVNAQADTMNQKIADLQKKIEVAPFEMAKKVEEKKPTRKEEKTKPDRSIEGISKQTLAQRDSFIRNGFEHYEYIANKSCCSVCAALDGKHFPVSELQIGVNAPPMHDGCCCSIAAWEDEEEYEAWLDYVSKGGTTKEWNKLKAKR